MSQQTQTSRLGKPWATFHSLTSADAAVMAELRAMVAPNKGRMRGMEARGAFDAIMEHTAPPSGVTFEPDTVGDVAGLWCKPEHARSGEAVLHIHGGWFNWGTAQAFRNTVGHIASAAGVAAFVPDYRLAPEHPFPAAPSDVRACYLGLVERDLRVAVVGDSAGGNLALGLVASLADSVQKPVGVVALSPVTDLTLSGASWQTRADADPYFVRSQAQELVTSYLDGHDASNSAASPLFAGLSGMPPVRVHVGDDEVLLDDSVRFVERAVKAGVDAKLEVWEGMPHGFVSGVGQLAASSLALQQIGPFLAERFSASGS